MAPRAQSGRSPKRMNESSTPPSSTILTAVKLLSIIRIATGAACIVAPRFTCAQHHYDLPDKHAFVLRMMGVREGVNGGLLITAGDREIRDGGKREIRRAIWAGMIADMFDIGTLAFGLAMGQVGNTTAGMIGGAAVGAIGLATLILRGL